MKVYDFPLPAGSPLPSSNNFHMAAIRRLYKINDEQLWHKVSNDFINRAAEYKITLDYLYRGPYTNLKGDGEYPALKRLNDKGELKSFCVVNSTVLPKYSAEVGNNPDHPEVGRLIERTRKHLEYWAQSRRNTAYGTRHISTDSTREESMKSRTGSSAPSRKSIRHSPS